MASFVEDMEKLTKTAQGPNTASTNPESSDTAILVWQEDSDGEILAYESIAKLEIHFNFYKCDFDHSNEGPSTTVRKVLSNSRNVIQLTLIFPDGYLYRGWETSARVHDMVSMCIKKFPKLKKFAIQVEGRVGNGYDGDDEFDNDDGYGDEGDNGDNGDDGDDGDSGDDRDEGGEASGEDGEDEESEDSDAEEQEEATPYPVKFDTIDQAFGFLGERERVASDHLVNAEPDFKSVWEAKRGEVLVWSPENERENFMGMMIGSDEALSVLIKQ